MDTNLEPEYLLRNGEGIHRQKISGTHGIPLLASILMPDEGKPTLGDSVESAGTKSWYGINSKLNKMTAKAYAERTW